MIKIPEDVLSRLCKRFRTDITQIKYLGGGKEYSDGITYTFQENEKIRVLKILAIPKKETEGLKRLEERIKFANFLGRNDINLAYPLNNLKGNLYETVETDDYIFPAYQMNMYEGWHVKAEGFTSDFFRVWGKVTGKLHKVTKSYPHWMNIPSESNNTRNGWQEELNIFYDWCKDDDVKQKWIEMKKRLSDLPLNRDTFGFIHNDNHTKNILWNNNDITLIDFDVANCHFFINDIAVALQSMLFHDAGGMISPVKDYDAIKSVINNFMEGYKQENHLDSFWLQHINTFINYRRLLLFTAMQGFLNNNLKLKQKYKYFIQNEPIVYVL